MGLMKTILIVDNAHITLSLLKEEFTDAGYEVLATDAGEEALAVLNNQSQNVDLVITNLRHAGPHGLEFIRLIKRVRPLLPVICHTALYEYQYLSPQDRPFDAFVEKSFDLTKLKEGVATLVHK